MPCLAGLTLDGLRRFRPCAQGSSGLQHLLLISLAILCKQFHRSREPILIFLEYIGGRRGFADMFGRFKRGISFLFL